MRTLLVSFSLLLAACSSQPVQIAYYQLAPLPAVTATVQPLPALQIQPLRVASYLNGSGLVLQQSAVEYQIARQHLWADALQQQMQRQLTQYLLLALPQQPLATGSAPAARQLWLEIDRFNADAAGQAVLSGRYRLSSAEREHYQPFEYQVALTADGYPAMVAALSEAWQQLLQDLASKLKAGV